MIPSRCFLIIGFTAICLLRFGRANWRKGGYANGWSQPRIYGWNNSPPQNRYVRDAFRFPEQSGVPFNVPAGRSMGGDAPSNRYVGDESPSGRSVGGGQWAYNLPHALVDESSSRRGGSGRKSKLTAGFRQNGDIEYVDKKENEEKHYRFVRPEDVVETEDNSRGLSPQALAKISETLGAINTVGRYLVNYTRGNVPVHRPNPDQNGGREDLPKALYTISKNVLGPNVTDTIAPIVRPLVTLTSGKVVVPPEEGGAGGGDGVAVRPCTTPDGSSGTCDDLSNCPQLLLNLSHLRQSICFKSLFVPGVCCPRRIPNQEYPSLDKPRPTALVEVMTTRRPLILTTNAVNSLHIQSIAKPTSFPIQSREADCGQAHTEKFRVVGGDEALPGRWPWMAAIFLHGSKRTEFWCGGALVGPKHILTAAHCTRDSRQRPFNAHQFTVRLGDIDLRRDDEPSSPETYYVTEIRSHPSFSRVGFYNDIAILVLDRKVRRTRYIQPLCLPVAPALKEEKFIGQKPTVVGWGTTYYGGKESAVQRQVELPVWKNDDCDKTYFQPITENFICAGLKEGGKDACQGDSGGPLMIKRDNRWMQIGIVSFGNKCGEPGYPGVYTRVTQYLDWIYDNMQ